MSVSLIPSVGVIANVKNTVSTDPFARMFPQWPALNTSVLTTDADVMALASIDDTVYMAGELVNVAYGSGTVPSVALNLVPKGVQGTYIPQPGFPFIRGTSNAALAAADSYDTGSSSVYVVASNAGMMVNGTSTQLAGFTGSIGTWTVTTLSNNTTFTDAVSGTQTINAVALDAGRGVAYVAGTFSVVDVAGVKTPTHIARFPISTFVFDATFVVPIGGPVTGLSFAEIPGVRNMLAVSAEVVYVVNTVTGMVVYTDTLSRPNPTCVCTDGAYVLAGYNAAPVLQFFNVDSGGTLTARTTPTFDDFTVANSIAVAKVTGVRVATGTQHTFAVAGSFDTVSDSVADNVPCESLAITALDTASGLFVANGVQILLPTGTQALQLGADRGTGVAVIVSTATAPDTLWRFFTLSGGTPWTFTEVPVAPLSFGTPTVVTLTNGNALLSGQGGSVVRSRAAAIKCFTGALTKWAPSANNLLYAAATNGVDTVYLSGTAVTEISSTPVVALGAVDATTGAYRSTFPGNLLVSVGTIKALVYSALAGSVLFAAGYDLATTGGVVPTRNIIAINVPIGGAAASVNTTFVVPDTMAGTLREVQCLAVNDAEKLVYAGCITNLYAFDWTDGTLVYTIATNGGIVTGLSMAQGFDQLYMSGSFTILQGFPGLDFHGLARIVGGRVGFPDTTFTPNINGFYATQFNCVAVVPAMNIVYAGAYPSGIYAFPTIATSSACMAYSPLSGPVALLASPSGVMAGFSDPASNYGHAMWTPCTVAFSGTVGSTNVTTMYVSTRIDVTLVNHLDIVYTSGAGTGADPLVLNGTSTLPIGTESNDLTAVLQPAAPGTSAVIPITATDNFAWVDSTTPTFSNIAGTPSASLIGPSEALTQKWASVSGSSTVGLQYTLAHYPGGTGGSFPAANLQCTAYVGNTPKTYKHMGMWVGCATNGDARLKFALLTPGGEYGARLVGSVVGPTWAVTVSTTYPYTCTLTRTGSSATSIQFLRINSTSQQALRGVALVSDASNDNAAVQQLALADTALVACLDGSVCVRVDGRGWTPLRDVKSGERLCMRRTDDGAGFEYCAVRVLKQQCGGYHESATGVYVPVADSPDASSSQLLRRRLGEKEGQEEVKDDDNDDEECKRQRLRDTCLLVSSNHTLVAPTMQLRDALLKDRAEWACEHCVFGPDGRNGPEPDDPDCAPHDGYYGPLCPMWPLPAAASASSRDDDAVVRRRVLARDTDPAAAPRLNAADEVGSFGTVWYHVALADADVHDAQAHEWLLAVAPRLEAGDDERHWWLSELFRSPFSAAELMGFTTCG